MSRLVVCLGLILHHGRRRCRCWKSWYGTSQTWPMPLPLQCAERLACGGERSNKQWSTLQIVTVWNTQIDQRFRKSLHIIRPRENARLWADAMNTMIKVGDKTNNGTSSLAMMWEKIDFVFLFVCGFWILDGVACQRPAFYRQQRRKEIDIEEPKPTRKPRKTN